MESSSTYEQDHVHAVYDVVAQDFSRTRHTKWPFVHRFVSSLPTGSVVLDAGCGNGKYLSSASILTPRKVDKDAGAWPVGKEPRALEATLGAVDGKGKGKGKGKEFTIERVEEDEGPGRLLSVGLDMCFPLLQIAAGRGHQVVRGDCFDLTCWRKGSFDHAISIATIHHFATDRRRMEAVKQLIQVVTPSSPSASTSSPPLPSKVLICVWALEQDPSLVGVGSARRGKKGAVRAVGIPVEGEVAVDVAEVNDGDEDEQDVFVPWELQGPKVAKPVAQRPVKKPYVRKPAPSTDVSETAAAPAPSTNEVAPPPPPPPSDLPPAPPSDSPTPETVTAAPKPTFNRYYHLFRNGELTSLVQLATVELGGVFVPTAQTGGSDSGDWGLEVSLEGGEERWERENWVVEINVRWRRA